MTYVQYIPSFIKLRTMVSIGPKRGKGRLSQFSCYIVIAVALVLIFHSDLKRLFSLHTEPSLDLENILLEKNTNDEATKSIAKLTKQLQDVRDELQAVRKGAENPNKEDSAANFPVKSSIYKKGFNPVFVYSNAATAAAEMPVKPGFSQVKQDVIIAALITASKEKTPSNEGGDYHPFFVDLAANHFMTLSNTLALEHKGWKGLCIEGNHLYWYDLARHRTCTIVGAFVGGKESEDGKQMKVVNGKGNFGPNGGIVGAGMDNTEKTKRGTDDRDIVSIVTIFKETKVPKIIDYFSLDVEGAESLVMEDFPWDEYTFRFLTIERPKPELAATLQGQGYNLLATIGRFGEEVWMHNKVSGISFDEASDVIIANGPMRTNLARDHRKEQTAVV